MAAGEKARGKSFFVQEQEERNQVPCDCFYRESVPRPHRPHARSKGKEEQPSPASLQVKLEAPTPSDSHARRTRALTSQVKRRI